MKVTTIFYILFLVINTCDAMFSDNRCFLRTSIPRDKYEFKCSNNAEYIRITMKDEFFLVENADLSKENIKNNKGYETTFDAGYKVGAIKPLGIIVEEGANIDSIMMHKGAPDKVLFIRSKEAIRLSYFCNHTDKSSMFESQSMELIQGKFLSPERIVIACNKLTADHCIVRTNRLTLIQQDHSEDSLIKSIDIWFDNKKELVPMIDGGIDFHKNKTLEKLNLISVSKICVEFTEKSTNKK